MELPSTRLDYNPKSSTSCSAPGAAKALLRRSDMNISILGTGNMAKGLATVFAQAGHSVVLANRDVTKAAAVAAELGDSVSAAGIHDAAAAGDVVVLAVPYAAAADLIAAVGGLANKIVVDITNPLTADYSGLTVGHTTSAAEEI